MASMIQQILNSNISSPALPFLPPNKFTNSPSYCYDFSRKRRSSWGSSCCGSSAAAASLAESSRKSSHSSVLLQYYKYEEEVAKKARIKKLFDHVDLSVSSYDTAWVAMVPDPGSSGPTPLFPKCIDWLLENQLENGSWSLPNNHPCLLKDVLSSTLASVLALKKWGKGDEHVHRGVCFIQQNLISASDERQTSPIGFDIIFPGMLEYARDIDLNLCLDSEILTALLQKRDCELRRLYESNSKESKEYLAYISEGVVKIQDWDMVMKFQRKNGSLFNSPSATAAAVLHVHNPECIKYLRTTLDKFGNAVPAVYPLDIYGRLCLVDNLERLGICQQFKEEIRNVLDDTYRCWQQRDEEIFAEASTCALAFQLLRTHGYDVSADLLTEFLPQDCCLNSFDGYWRDIHAVLQLYRASELILHDNDSVLKRQNIWSRKFLKDQISNVYDIKGFGGQVYSEVENILKLPSYASLQRVTSRKSIEQYDLDNTRVLKTSYRSSNFSNKDLLSLAVQDFNHCQYIHRDELKQLERWVVENRLDELKFARQKSAYCYFSASATMFWPELSDARMAWAKNSILTTVVDDFFDVGGSMEELKNLIELVEKWDVKVSENCCSESVQIIYSALHSTIGEIGNKAFKWQARDVTSHIIEIWLDLLNSMLRESEWARKGSRPTINEYMENGYVSFALGPIILPALYFVGPKLSEEIAKGPEMHVLYKLVSTCGRLLNDIRGFEREAKDGKLNAATLHLLQGVTEADSIVEMKRTIENQRRELLRLVLQKEGSVVPRACKDLFWNMSKVLHQFYIKDDGFTSQELIELVKSIIHEPLPSV
ncbi:OLC1v1022202C1 [Oldenlandia corymbosa var. corymbosa]|uniref:OLC1v1022202C1 n=1 Tax=Oldenlandia corymbosa var. corymbosa TaxID=529605 RepID=A0AAV1BZ10_OLDCO|nr:OLC1v1022202C1 [Oldenlandia corymbosa var. corymbosa]